MHNKLGNMGQLGQSTVTLNEALLSWRYLNICLLMGNGELIPHFALPVCTASVLSIKPPLSPPMFSHFFPI